MVREPVVCGAFYPSNPERLKMMLADFFGEEYAPELNKLMPPSGVIVPHAGYVYSGATAAKAYKKVFQEGKANRVFLIGPNHTGLGSPISIYEKGSWKTPLGLIEVDDKTSKYLIEKINQPNDEIAHFREHSLEVQLPFLQYILNNDFQIVPICLMDQSLKTAKRLGKIIREIIEEGDLIVASTDMNHYESHEKTIEKDNKIIEAIKNLDLEAMYDSIRRYNISMCGFGTVATAISVGFTKVEIVEHITSGEKSGDYHAVVGYLSGVLSGLT
ncbi:MAG TPA: AmmeMemoRadiSam system protein B [Defluviitoga sp.]|nr:AmmeMemoRadiSam system protein B [Defluviitoga sp.]HOP23859.1 AmmeMemoRadiSam system protein B [Defluviitoga sp.]HPZ28394.1 AmmeMemoRadiSam system protein B [Defluviitoga sp.]HQD62492.1 AmmeMemoRadiSam system protein B [Defluviitoga sp.]